MLNIKYRSLFAALLSLWLTCATVFGQATKPNPADSGVTTTSKLPLFAATGPGIQDGFQTLNGDCGVIAFFKGWSLEDPAAIKSVIHQLPNGDYSVHTQLGFGFQDWEITPDYSTRWQAAPANGNWMVALEKTTAIYYNGGSFQGIGGLAPFQVGHNVFGCTDYGVGGSDMPKDEAALVAWLQGELTKKHTMVVGTGGAFLAPSLVANHFYYIMDVKQVSGVWTVYLGSPWGSPWDVQITATNFLLQFQEISSQKLEIGGGNTQPPPPATLPSPVVTLVATTATDSSINPRHTIAFVIPKGAALKLEWASSGGASAVLRKTQARDETVPLNSSITLTPATSSTYTVIVTGPDGKVASAILLVGVKP